MSAERKGWGKRIKLLRTFHGLTQAQLGERLGTTQQTIARWESEFSAPSIYAAMALAKELHRSFETIFGV